MNFLLYICKQKGTVVRLSHPVPPPARLIRFSLAVDFLKVVNGAFSGNEIIAMKVFAYYF